MVDLNKGRDFSRRVQSGLYHQRSPLMKVRQSKCANSKSKQMTDLVSRIFFNATFELKTIIHKCKRSNHVMFCCFIKT